jgi:hypothetical protein
MSLPLKTGLCFNPGDETNASLRQFCALGKESKSKSQNRPHVVFSHRSLYDDKNLKRP